MPDQNTEDDAYFGSGLEHTPAISQGSVHLLTNQGTSVFTCERLLDNTNIDSVYTDGGIIGSNPSAIGGTWSAVFVSGNALVAERSGVILPNDVWRKEDGIGHTKLVTATIENNIAETIAIMLALESLPAGWRGTLYGDNLNSIRRARDLKIKDAVPKFIKDRLLKVRETVAPAFVLLGGHPTLAEVEAGARSDGKPVSRWNVRADKLCREAAAKHLKAVAP